MTALYILIGLAVLVALYVIVTYNGLVSLKNRVAEAWSDIEVQMKVRYNLIPNLVETVKGYMGHERETLESVTRLRGAAMSGLPKALEAQLPAVLRHSVLQLVNSRA